MGRPLGASHKRARSKMESTTTSPFYPLPTAPNHPLNPKTSFTMSSGGLHARTNSIKRTPSDLSRSLAEQDLPPPSAITKSSTAGAADAAAEKVNQQIAGLDADEPEGK